MNMLRRVELDDIVALRERVLTEGHPGRPVRWPYDNELARHYGVLRSGRILACVSLTPQPMPGQDARNPFHLHSMAVEAPDQRLGLGRQMLSEVAELVADRRGDLLWATSRLAAVAFYLRCDFQAGDHLHIPPTGAEMRYVWRQLPG